MATIRDSKYIGMKIKLRRTKLGMSQAKLGEMVGVTYQQIQKYEKGKNKINAEMLQKVAQSLNVNIDFFFQNVDEVSAFTSDEQELLKRFRTVVNDECRGCFLSLLGLVSKNPGGK